MAQPNPSAERAAPPEPSELTLVDILRVLLTRWLLVTAWTALLTLVAIGASYVMRPIFRAEVLASPTIEERNPLGAISAQFGGLADLAGLGVQGNRSAAIATLKSRSLTEEFIRDRGLLPVLFEGDWHADAGRWKSDDPEKVPTLWEAYRVFDRDIRKVLEDRKTGLVTLAIEWRDPTEAADWANELVRRANVRLQQDTIAEGQKTIAYLEKQLESAGAVEVRRALYNLVEAETKKIAIANAREEFGFKIIDAAVPPKRRIRPNRKLMALTGLLLGLIGSSLWVLVSHTMKEARRT